MPDPEPLLAGAHAVPNPMSPVLGTGTRLRFTLAADATVTARVYDREGEDAGQIFSGSLAAGDREIAWDGRTAAGTALANGVYLVRLQADAPGWTGAGRSVVVRVAVWNER
jgi:flagellar hook assembly protein FlgD